MAPPAMPFARRAWGLAVAVLVCLAVAGCTAPQGGADQQRQNGFYGGVSGGAAHP